ncbi:MAG: hypothetical protein KF687_13785 [Cyclobacteriaceae bacterium]|nr:hypothetical protein [Cyclobacteriaceae bacterium]
MYNVILVYLVLFISEKSIDYLLKNPKKIPASLVRPARAYYVQHIRSTIQMEPECAIYDKELFYTLKPGICNFRNLEFSTKIEVNIQGLRDDEESLDNPEIILLGDSFAMGWGVDQDSTFEKIMERSLDKKILNTGISSYGTVRSLKLLQRLQLKNLKTIILQYHDSDLVENMEFANTNDSLIISSEELYIKTSASVRKKKQYFFGKHTALLSKFIIKKLLGRLEERKATDSLDVEYFIHALKTLPIPNDVEIIVFELSSYGNDSSKFIEILNSRLGDLEGINVKAVNIQQKLTEGDYFILDDHINAQGHKKVAAELVKTLEFP